nr:PREDICTED: uncharacterized protein LOC108217462 [Daucus carota subsp. sativus]
MFNQFHSLLEIGTERSEWSISVRVQALWKSINRTTNEFRGYNMVLTDVQGCRIHAFIMDKVSDKFESLIEEGDVYNISNFKVKKYEGKEQNRVVRNEKHIFFDYQTKLKKMTEELFTIPPYAFDLFPLQEMEKIFNDNYFLVDVIGKLEQSALSTYVSKEDSKKTNVKFKIFDASAQMNVTFFNLFGESFEKALKAMAEAEVIIVIACAKVNKYEGELYLTNYPATRFYLNPKHYSLIEFENSVTRKKAEEQLLSKMFTIAEIKNLTDTHIEKDVRCSVKVKKVEEQYNWYENCCPGCGEEVNKVEGRFRCTAECKRNIPWPDKRFRLTTVCSDASGILAIIFPDDEIQRIIGKEVFDIENDESQVGADGSTFPPLLKEFEKRDYIVTITISALNINKTSKVYKAKKLDNPEENLGENEPAELKSAETVDHTMETVSETVAEPRTSSPPTEKSSNRPRGIKNKIPVKCGILAETPNTKMKKS